MRSKPPFLVMLLCVLMTAASARADEAETEPVSAGPVSEAVEEAAPQRTPHISRRAEIRPGKGPTVVVPLQGPVTKAQFIFLRRAIKDAARLEAGAFVVDMDTPGGDLEAAVNIVDVLQRTDRFTITYVDKNAASAGALIALATDRIYMAPVSAIGAAAPVMGGGSEIPETMNEKIVSYYSKYFRGAAEVSGHNPDIAEAFINKRKEVVIAGEVISAEDSLLTLSPQEAVREMDGRPLLAAGIADSVEDLVAQAELNAEVIRLEPTGFEVVAMTITMFAPLFMLGGIIGAYMEFRTPGFGVPGIVSAICFLLFFAGHYLAGLTGHEVIALFVLGIVLILIEIIFVPGVVVLALAGVVAVLGSLFLAMVDRYPGQDFIPPDPAVLAGPAINMLVTLGGGAMIVFVLANFLPKTRLFDRLVLHSALPAGGSLAEPANAAADGETELDEGMTGVALTLLRPSGTADFGGKVVDVLSEGAIIARGDAVWIVGLRDGHVIVAPVGSGQ